VTLSIVCMQQIDQQTDRRWAATTRTLLTCLLLTCMIVAGQLAWMILTIFDTHTSGRLQSSEHLGCMFIKRRRLTSRHASLRCCGFRALHTRGIGLGYKN